MSNRMHVMMFIVVFVLAALAQAQTFTGIFSFDGSDGSYPFTGRLVLDHKTGTLYGTTYYGGSDGYGTVFSVTTPGTQTVLYNFTGGSDGGYPFAPVVRDSSGNLYGTTSYGGAYSSYGVVYKLDTAGNETVLHSFAGGTSDLCYPYQGVARDKSGTLYGTATGCGANSYGGIYEIDTAGNETILHNFRYSLDGAYPYYGSLRLTETGLLWGVCSEGGTYGYGTLYSHVPGNIFHVLHNFAGPPGDGAYPYGTVARDGKRNSYGTTSAGGSNDYYGTVWEVSSSGTETILYNGNYDTSDCAGFGGGVARTKDGLLYGLAELGGSDYAGCLYQINNGTFMILHSFTDGSDGGYPFGDEVTLASSGTLYGATQSGGSSGYGTVWSYVP